MDGESPCFTPTGIQFARSLLDRRWTGAWRSVELISSIAGNMLSASHVYTQPRRYALKLLGNGIVQRQTFVIDPLAATISDENDPRGGANSRGDPCKTCNNDRLRCPGHLGAYLTYELPVPIVNRSLMLWAGVVCANCGRIALSKDEIDAMVKRTGSASFSDISNSLGQKPADHLCPHCATILRILKPVPYPVAGNLKVQFPALYYRTTPRKEAGRGMRTAYKELDVIDNRTLRDILAKATIADCELVGFHMTFFHPINFISKYVPIPPPAARPATQESHFAGAGAKSGYESIVRLQRIIGPQLKNKLLEELRGQLDESAFRSLILDIHHLYFVIAIMQVSIPDDLYNATHGLLGFRAKQPQSLLGMLKGKRGLFRRNVVSTRHDMCTRGPLIGYVDGMIGTATFPRRAAMKILRPMMITPRSIDFARLLVRDGPHRYPGANSFTRNGVDHAIRDDTAELIASSLIPGDIIMRHTLTGDVGLHQRYPSLRQESISAVVLNVQDGKLVALPPMACLLKMADFDGDDTEIFINSCLAVDAEALVCQSVLTQFITTMNGSVGFGWDAGLESDAITGFELLSRRASFTQQEVNILFEATRASDPPRGKDSYTPSDIINHILPRGLYYDARRVGDAGASRKVAGSDGSMKTEWLRIVDGTVEEGRIGPSAFMIGDAHLLKTIAGSIGVYPAIELLDAMTRVSHMYNKLVGVSIADDIRALSPNRERAAAIMRGRERRMYQHAIEFHTGKAVTPVGMDPMVQFEYVQTNVLANLWSGELFDSVLAALKGTALDRVGYKTSFAKRLVFGLGGRGQVLVVDHIDRPHRPQMNMSRGTRQLCYFPKGYDGPDAAGFIAGAYVSGLNPIEHFQDMRADRKTIYDKGMSLSEQGYYNRKLGISCDMIYVDYLGMVRGHGEKIHSFTYGSFGSGPRASYPIIVDAHLISTKAFEERYAGVCAAEMTVLRAIRDEWRETQTIYSQRTMNDNYEPLRTRFNAPINLPPIILEFTSPLSASSGASSGGAAAEPDWNAVRKEMMAHESGIPSSAAPAAGAAPAAPATPVRTAAEPSVDWNAPLTADGAWEMLREFEVDCERAHIGERAGAFIRRIVAARVAAFMRIFRFTVHGGLIAGWRYGRARMMLNRILEKYELSLASPGDTVGRKAVLDVVSPQTQEMLHSTRGKGAGAGGSLDMLRRSVGTKLFREITEGMKPRAPILSMQLNMPAPLDFERCVEFMKRHSSIRLRDVLIEAYLISISPDKLKSYGSGASDLRNRTVGTNLKLDRLIDWISGLPPSVRAIYDKMSKSWFYIVVRLDAKSLHMNYIDPFEVAPRLYAQFRARVAFIAPIYDNLDGLYLIINMSPQISFDQIRKTLEDLTTTAFIHGRPGFDNGSVIEYRGIALPDETSGEMKTLPIYRVMFNGSDMDYVLSDACAEVDRESILISNVRDNLYYYGIEETRFRAVDLLNATCEQSETLKGTNMAHLQTIVGQLCYRGDLSFIPRGGVAANPDIDPLEKASFETPGDFIRRHIVNPASQPIKSTVPTLIYGNVQRIGSGISRIRVRRDAMFPTKTADRVMDELESPASESERPTRDASTTPLVDATPIDSVHARP